MHFDLTETQTLVRDTARRFAQKIREGAAERDRTKHFPVDIFKEMAELGLMGVNVSADYGGSEAGVVAYSLAVSEIAQADASVAVTMCVNNMVAEVIQEFGNEAQRKEHIPRLMQGEYIAGSFCLSEPGSGSDAAGMATVAIETDDGYVINGAKAWITSGAYAGVYIVWAKVNDGDKESITAFLVDPQSEGIHVGKPEEKMGQHASNTVPLSFDDVQVPKEAVLGEVGMGFRIAMMALDGGRVGIASQALGIAREAAHVAAEYSEERKQFGKPISRFQATQFKLADMAVQLDAAEALTLKAAWLKEQKNRRFTREASVAKLYSSEMACRICDEAIQILGGYGYTRDYPVERLARDVRVTRIYEGTSEIQRIVIAREVLKAL